MPMPCWCFRLHSLISLLNGGTGLDEKVLEEHERWGCVCRAARLPGHGQRRQAVLDESFQQARHTPLHTPHLWTAAHRVRTPFLSHEDAQAALHESFQRHKPSHTEACTEKILPEW
jgi:hypothetical protein